jgi:hypothetical protein
MGKLGKSINGIYTVGGLSILDPDALTGFQKTAAVTYRDKMAKYSKDQKLSGTGFATQGFGGIINIWMMMDLAGGTKATGLAVQKKFKATKGHVAFGATGMNCGTAIKPYIAVCASEVSISQWNGTKLKAVKGAQDINPLVVVGKGDALRLEEVN